MRLRVRVWGFRGFRDREFVCVPRALLLQLELLTRMSQRT